jgi:uncharacterized protein (DUF58 family)
MADLIEINIAELKSIELLAKQIVEGFITGMHKSPFHGFSVEFAEHRLYNTGESTRHIDWKLYAKTKKLFVKKYEEETNLRCHLIIDNSASMYFPNKNGKLIYNVSKINFATIASAALIELLKRQRDAVGLSIYSDKSEYYAPAKGSESHSRKLFAQLDALLQNNSSSGTETYQMLHEISEKIHKRSLVFLFTDMFQTNKNQNELFDALRHLKYNKHEVILFHTFDGKLELEFNFDNSPKKFMDIETGEEVKIYPHNVQEKYQEQVENYFNDLKLKCIQYKIDYVPIDIRKGFNQLLSSYLIKRNRIL